MADSLADADQQVTGFDADTAQRLGDMAALVSSGVPPQAAALRVRVRDEGVEAERMEATLGDVDALARAAVGFDVDELNRVLEENFALGTLDEVVDGWLLPALHRLGVAWADGRVSVAEEHFVSASVQRRLARAYDETPRPSEGPQVLIGLASGSRHELGVLAFATALRQRGVDTVYLGGDVPVAAWVEAVQQRHPDGVVIAVPGREDVVGSRELVAALAEVAPDLSVMVGGSQQDLITDHVTRLGHQMVAAADRLAGALLAKL
ncbi:cobalamin B12-binding domain-containing protein [Nocardioides gilvus]|uniref:cobalamin B12-binding domain-containing protein n=1 Tax=Nocardioides gilvus TaxID=1735589 RepID=UPI0013A55C27|nr:B12-binding domain-containing protein [Nocardioides gilvus]